jgi:hypothetical protein
METNQRGETAFASALRFGIPKEKGTEKEREAERKGVVARSGEHARRSFDHCLVVAS